MTDQTGIRTQVPLNLYSIPPTQLSGAGNQPDFTLIYLPLEDKNPSYFFLAEFFLSLKGQSSGHGTKCDGDVKTDQTWFQTKTSEFYVRCTSN